MISKKKTKENRSDVDKLFFDVDQKNKTTKVVFRFDSPDDIFDESYASKTPLISQEFLEKIKSTFELVPSKHKIDLTVRFGDLNGYDEEALSDIFQKNLSLEYESHREQHNRNNKTAYYLILVGLVSFLFMLLIDELWTVESLAKDIFVYVSDISTTVSFWEAMTILIVEQGEDRSYLRDLKKRFVSIQFCKEEDTVD